MRQTALFVLMLVLLFVWLALWSWLLGYILQADLDVFMLLFSGGTLLSVLAVLCAAPWWIRRQLMPRAVEHDHSEPFAFAARILQRQAALLKLHPPRLMVYEDSALNAFIVGSAWRHQHLYLSKALLTQLSRDEIEAVMAHELAHIYHRDMVMNEVFAGMGLLWVKLLQHGLGGLLACCVPGTPRLLLAKRMAVVVTYAGLLLPLWLVLLHYSRRSEYRADALASQLVGNQRFLGLLHRLRGICRDSYFSLGEPQDVLRRYFTTHPSLQHRITALESHQQA
ncbi:MAG: M48 family metalloprotease [Gammaproteobacteria bacterium]